jgi:hypothetical protein
MSTLADRTATAEARRYADAITQARAQLVYAIGTATGPVIDDAEVLLREAALLVQYGPFDPAGGRDG